MRDGDKKIIYGNKVFPERSTRGNPSRVIIGRALDACPMPKIVSCVGLEGEVLKNKFIAKIKLFEREKGWYHVSVPTELSRPLEHLADRGLIAVTAAIGKSNWPTSLLPMGDGTHFIALLAKVRSREKLVLGEMVEVSFEIRQRV